MGAIIAFLSPMRKTSNEKNNYYDQVVSFFLDSYVILLEAIR